MNPSEALARDLEVHTAAGRTVWCIFDNTASGAAMPNALELLHAQAGQASSKDAILPQW